MKVIDMQTVEFEIEIIVKSLLNQLSNYCDDSIQLQTSGSSISQTKVLCASFHSISLTLIRCLAKGIGICGAMIGDATAEFKRGKKIILPLLLRARHCLS